MKRKPILLIACLIIAGAFSASGQKNPVDSLLSKFYNEFVSGKLFDAESTLLKVFDYKASADKKQLYTIYNYSGILNNTLGKYKNSLKYFDKAEDYLGGNEPELLATLYINKGVILNTLKQYDASNLYLERGIRIFNGVRVKTVYGLSALSAAYLNYGLNLLETNQPAGALTFFSKSLEIKVKNKLSGISLVYANQAKAYEALGDFDKAGGCYRMSIENAISVYGGNYIRLPETYFYYARFLRRTGKNSEALRILHTALKICKLNYGNKHTIVSKANMEIGDHFMEISGIDSALYYYQKSLIAVVPGYNNDDYMDNPALDTVLYDNRLLEDLKKKSLALEKLGDSKNQSDDKIKLLTKSIETNDLAISLIERIRKVYPTEEDRLYLIKNERNTYSDAIRQVNKLYELTADEELILTIYDIARKAKAAALLDAITGNDIKLNLEIPDSLERKISDLITARNTYEEHIREAQSKENPDTAEINNWKDKLFGLTRELEVTRSMINDFFPDYQNLLLKSKPKPLSEVRSQLGSKETILDYYIDNQYINNKRALIAFVVSREGVSFHQTSVDSVFFNYIADLKKLRNPWYANSGETGNIIGSLYSLYSVLISPVEKMLSGNRIIVIPAEELSGIPFDALIATRPEEGNNSFDGQDFLLHKYAISYGYSSSLIKNPGSRKWSGLVTSFAPDYSFTAGEINELAGASAEIGKIKEEFECNEYTSGNATIKNFRSSLERSDILHLAMHSVMDSSNSKFSYLIFDKSENDSLDNLLFSYDIGLLRLKSPMVVLSTCNSGTGTLYHGEGVMSLAREFIIAGAASVIRTSWEVNDEVSSAIITDFYKFLAKGYAKDEALRKAKAEYITSNPPLMQNPYYWAAYEIMGDNSAMKVNRITILCYISAVLLLIMVSGFFYLRWRRSFSERSL